MSSFTPILRSTSDDRGVIAPNTCMKEVQGAIRINAYGGNLFVIGQGQFEQLQRIVFNRKDRHVFAVLDGAIIDNLPQRLQQSAPNAMCLFSGDLDPMLAAAAPYLVQLHPDTEITRLVLQDGWDEHWGIILTTGTNTNLQTLRAHLRRVLRVKTPDGSSMLFRFYDPRAFRSVVPTFDQEQRATFFGAIHTCHIEGRVAGSVLSFHREENACPRMMPLTAVA